MSQTKLVFSYNNGLKIEKMVVSPNPPDSEESLDPPVYKKQRIMNRIADLRSALKAKGPTAALKVFISKPVEPVLYTSEQIDKKEAHPINIINSKVDWPESPSFVPVDKEPLPDASPIPGDFENFTLDVPLETTLTELSPPNYGYDFSDYLFEPPFVDFSNF
jgi:hypothetical protein